MKIFVVFRGKYSDRDIVTVAESRQLAEKYIELHSRNAFRNEPFSIEEWDSDDTNENTIQEYTQEHSNLAYQFTFAANGELCTSIDEDDPNPKIVECDTIHEGIIQSTNPDARYIIGKDRSAAFNSNLYLNVYIPITKANENNPEIALKAARDLRSQYLSEKLGL